MTFHVILGLYAMALCMRWGYVIAKRKYKMETKTCSKCKQTHEIEFFNISQGGMRRSSWCRACTREAVRQSYAKKKAMKPSVEVIRKKTAAQEAEETRLFNQLNRGWT